MAIYFTQDVPVEVWTANQQDHNFSRTCANSRTLYPSGMPDVTPGSPADAAGLRGGSQATSIYGLSAGGDLLIAIDGQELQTFSDMLNYLFANKSPGDKVIFTVLRDDETIEVELTLDKRP